MPETNTVVFSYKEIAEALIRYNNIHEGLWGLYVEFGLQAGNIGPGPTDLLPAAIVPITKLGLQRFKETTNLTVDAAQVNPSSGAKIGRKKK
jgi:hypothetical protein